MSFPGAGARTAAEVWFMLGQHIWLYDAQATEGLKAWSKSISGLETAIEEELSWAESRDRVMCDEVE